MARIRISAPDTATAGDVIEIKTMIQHPMESGFRRDARGEPIERNIIKHFKCEYQGAIVFAAEFFPAIAANPFLTFHLRATKTGEIKLSWTDEHGALNSQKHILTVT